MNRPDDVEVNSSSASSRRSRNSEGHDGNDSSSWSSGSSYYSSDDNSTSGHSDDSSGYLHPEDMMEAGGFGLLSSLRQRVQRRASHAASPPNNWDQSNLPRENPIQSSTRVHSNSSGTFEQRMKRWYLSWARRPLGRDRNHCTVSKLSSRILGLSIFVWAMVHLFSYKNSTIISEQDIHYIQAIERRRQKHNPKVKMRHHTRAELDEELRLRRQQSSPGILEGISNGVQEAFHKATAHVSEATPRGCQLAEWQQRDRPINCNDIHELPMISLMPNSKRYHPVKEAFPKHLQDKNIWQSNYLSSGLWRDVWSLVPSFGSERVVLKVMKPEHDVDQRNIDRHRREALVMEKLTSHPNIVDIYGYCGTTVVTEWGAAGLDTLLAPPSQAKWLHHSVKDPVLQGITRGTPLGRLKLAREVTRGVAGLHTLKDSATGFATPILHADIQAKQFIVTQKGVVKINDFNRCRFLPYQKEKKSTKERKFCPIYIPSAPGSQRSPEEYLMHPLDEKLDVFSLGNVLFHILTGQKPWGDGIIANSVKKTIRSGGQPIIPTDYRKEGTFDAALSVLIDMTFEFDPKNRIQASELMAELDRLIDVYPNLPADLASRN